MLLGDSLEKFFMGDATDSSITVSNVEWSAFQKFSLQIFAIIRSSHQQNCISITENESMETFCLFGLPVLLQLSRKSHGLCKWYMCFSLLKE